MQYDKLTGKQVKILKQIKRLNGVTLQQIQSMYPDDKTQSTFDELLKNGFITRDGGPIIILSELMPEFHFYISEKGIDALKKYPYNKCKYIINLIKPIIVPVIAGVLSALIIRWLSL